MKKISKLAIYSYIILALMPSSLTFADTYAAPSASLTTPKDYNMLVPIPGMATAQGKTTATIQSYLPKLFTLVIGIAALLAFIMITVGGVMYATSDALSSKQEGRSYITNAIVGLLLVLTSWIILSTINPGLLNLNLIIPNVNVIPPPSTGIVTAGVPMTQEQINESNRIASLLGQTNNPCTLGQTTNCVNFNGISPAVVTGMNNLSNSCSGSSIAITGATEAGHSVGSAHNRGTAVDIRTDQQLNSCIATKARSLSPGKLVACQTYSLAGGSYLWEPKGSTCGAGNVPSTGDHWHVGF